MVANITETKKIIVLVKIFASKSLNFSHKWLSLEFIHLKIYIFGSVSSCCLVPIRSREKLLDEVGIKPRPSYFASEHSIRYAIASWAYRSR